MLYNAALICLLTGILQAKINAAGFNVPIENNRSRGDYGLLDAPLLTVWKTVMSRPCTASEQGVLRTGAKRTYKHTFCHDLLMRGRCMRPPEAAVTGEKDYKVLKCGTQKNASEGKYEPLIMHCKKSKVGRV